MRDFRVATVFEGTTEIHSIYPPIFLVRKIAKLAKEKGRGRLATLVFMTRSLLGGKHWPLEVKDVWLKRALRVCRSNMRRVRWLLFWGTLLHGRRLLRKEYLLRRITHLSLHAFGILSVTSRLASEERRGALVMSDVMLLKYLVHEAREDRCKDNRFFDTSLEKLNSRIVEELA
jgi:acyl-CoA dehydrogenase family protein 9